MINILLLITYIILLPIARYLYECKVQVSRDIYFMWFHANGVPLQMTMAVSAIQE